jgi:hypothetical protein
LIDVASSVTKRYSSVRYADGAADWSRDALADLVHDTVVLRLVHEDRQQLAYAVELGRAQGALTGDDAALETFRRVIGKQIKDVLAERYRSGPQRTHVDTEFDAMRRLLQRDDAYEPGWRPSAFHAADAIQPAAAENPTDADLERAALAIRAVPRRAPDPHGSQRSIYRSGDRGLVVDVITRVLDDVTLTELRKILEIVLTPWLAAPVEEDVIAGLVDQLDGKQELEARTLAEAVFDQLTAAQRFELRHLLNDEPDQRLAEILGISRTAVVMRRRAINDVLRRVLVDVDIDLARASFDELRRLLARSLDDRAEAKPS